MSVPRRTWIDTRRSGRNNGQQPELSITDPVQLERRLKRQWSNEAASDTHASEEENEESQLEN